MQKRSSSYLRKEFERCEPPELERCVDLPRYSQLFERGVVLHLLGNSDIPGIAFVTIRFHMHLMETAWWALTAIRRLRRRASAMRDQTQTRRSRLAKGTTWSTRWRTSPIRRTTLSPGTTGTSWWGAHTIQKTGPYSQGFQFAYNSVVWKTQQLILLLKPKLKLQRLLQTTGMRTLNSLETDDKANFT